MLALVRNVNIPMAVLVTGAVMCLLAGYLLGAVTAPDTASRSTATVVSYDKKSGELCLEGSATESMFGADGSTLCGFWSRSQGAKTPRAGDTFRFVSVGADAASGDADQRQVLIYGDVVK